MKKHKEEMNDEKFVGNISKIDSDLRYFELNNINYRLGSEAYDIRGKIMKNGLSPLFIKADSLKKYDKLMRKLSGFTTNVEEIILG